MEMIKLRSIARASMSLGSLAILIGIAIMVAGYMNFGDGVLVVGVLVLIVGTAMLARTPTGDEDAS